MASAAPITHNFADDGRIPNNPTLPLVLYRGGIDLTGSPDPEAVIEKTFAANGWGNMWRNGIYPYVHYHSMIHEAMGIARGRATVRFGGENGEKIEITPGDVVILPAGTGHQCLSASADFSVVGAYPPGAKMQVTRPTPENHAKALKTIPLVELPKSDPIMGKDGPLVRLWRRETRHKP